MKIKIDFIDSIIDFDNSNVYSFEIHNKKYLYRISSLFYGISNGDLPEEIECFDKENNELKLSNKIRFFSEYFDFGFDSKKYSTDIAKYILSNIEQYDSENILRTFSKLCKLIDNELQKTDLSISVSTEEGIENVIKMFKLKINQKEDLLDNLLLIVDLEVALNSNKILCFMNLKQFLTKEEVIEFYKYATYNSIKIIMIESTKYDYFSNYEKVIVIDQNLDESMI
ncbi:MAG: type II-A CRISPR-associated protein Csn2 [Mollicutes bacterium]|nr:type II-A CRISPR-associated protein Csn2 [Mollicutes bacterium]